MKISIVLFVLSLAISSCNVGSDGDFVNEFPNHNTDTVVQGFYRFTVNSSLGGQHSFMIEGEENHWIPSSCHFTLGPDGGPCDKPRASLWFTCDPITLNLENGKLDTSIVPKVSFYSVLYPCEDIGKQEANWYDFNGENFPGIYWVGRDVRGFDFIRGAGRLKLERRILNQADVPEQIDLFFDCIAVHE